ncbi:hypothetical protein [Ferrimonas marina]|uniref:Uncharacterized protein n=1 Tax=Ferrimonas marina TaxID=299255 RepID=A0A1M5X8T8_9GAMM|nr:hypothetical protein [Ferrimonas marina]SHH95998.1 hypothetical protein SAMN02745129_3320 [Ferrimonas marina]
MLVRTSITAITAFSLIALGYLLKDFTNSYLTCGLYIGIGGIITLSVWDEFAPE